MSRRGFLEVCSLGLLNGVALACSPRSASTPAPATGRAERRKIEAICFDLFTIFDPRSVVRVAERYVPQGASELCAEWRSRQFQYSWLRVASAQYLDFETTTLDALSYAEAARGITLSAEARQALVAAYSELEPWPDTRDALAAWKAAGIRLAPLSNYTPGMLERLMANAGLTPFFELLISTHPARTFKPDPRAYALGVQQLGLPREAIAFAAFGGWDAAGAKWFGFPTFWVNRLGVPAERLAPGADATGPTLAELGAFVTAG
jgi:2-haloacid dehalogenase